jgi:hypothetical protein
MPRRRRLAIAKDSELKIIDAKSILRFNRIEEKTMI